MANIDIEKKSGMSMWAWLIPLLIIIALLWWFMSRGDGEVPAPATGADTVGVVDGVGTTNVALAAVPVARMTVIAHHAS